jgi:hypothetical protein
MATTLQDLLDDLIALADDPARRALPEHGLAVFAPAARALNRLLVDRLHNHVGQNRELAVGSVASACTRAAETWPDAEPSRLGDLMSATCDVVGLLRFELNQAGRWAAAVAISEAVEHCARLAQRHPPWAGVLQLRRVRNSAALVEQLAARHPPRAGDAAILNRPIPIVDPLHAGAAPRFAAEAAAAILDRLLQPTHRAELTLRELLAISLAAETTTHYGAAVAASDTRAAGNEPWRQSPTAWRVLRHTLARSFDDGTVRQPSPSRRPAQLTSWALHMHEGFHRASRVPPSDVPSALRHPVGADLQAAVALLPLIAQAMHDHLHAWSRDGTLITRAGLPRRDEHGQRRRVDDLVRADRYDLFPIMTAASAAGLLSTALSAEIARHAGDRPEQPLSRLAAAHQARFGTSRDHDELRRRAEQTRRRATHLRAPGPTGRSR